MNSDGKRCATKYCRNDAAKGRTICHKCHSRRAKVNNPLLYHFNALRNNARRRGKEFKLTLQEFKEFCNDTNYMEEKGKTPTSLTIDRIDHRQGYEIDNIQVLSHYENSAKGYQESQD